MMNLTSEIVPNWLISSPDPNVSIGHLCEPFKIEMVIRGYLSGHAAREYKKGNRMLCGVNMPDGMIENDKFPKPIITPATKAESGNHDEDISKEDIISRNIVSKEDYKVLETYTKNLFDKGTSIAKERGLILVDTKYEFGKTKDGKIVLIDEIHTPDSSRYFYSNGYKERQKNNQPQKQLSKEFLRQWLISNNFQGLEGQSIPLMSDEYISTVSDRYIELYENITGEKFIKADNTHIENRINTNINNYLEAYFGN
jgi:phosphoribosylaminoimidazole-succinocarboxamide synthase